MTKKEHIQYWLKSAKDDLKTADQLFITKRYQHCLFFAHLHLEKICKAIWVKYNKTNYPPKIHNLNKILSQTPLLLTDEEKYFLEVMNKFCIAGRYPDYIQSLYKIANKRFTYNKLEKVKKFKI